MKKQLLKSLLAAAIIVAAPAASFATTIWATAVEYADQNSDDVLAERSNTDEALYAPDSTGFDNKWYSLGTKGFAVFSFGTAFAGDSYVYEITNGRDSYTYESADIWVANTYTIGDDETGLGSDFVYVGHIENDIENSLFVTGAFKYLLIRDTSEYPKGVNGDGYDVDAIGVTPVPEPATMMLFGAGIAGLAAISRRRK